MKSSIYISSNRKKCEVDYQENEWAACRGFILHCDHGQSSQVSPVTVSAAFKTCARDQRHFYLQIIDVYRWTQQNKTQNTQTKPKMLWWPLRRCRPAHPWSATFMLSLWWEAGIWYVHFLRFSEGYLSYVSFLWQDIRWKPLMVVFYF